MTGLCEDGSEPPGSLKAIQSNHQLRMDVYTFPELADMVMCYGEARGNGRRALHMYQQRFQNRNHLHHTIFAGLYKLLRDDGSLRPRRIGGRPCRHPFSIDDFTELKGKVGKSRVNCPPASPPRIGATTACLPACWVVASQSAGAALRRETGTIAAVAAAASQSQTLGHVHGASTGN
ncbi:hypothetical protein ANN_14850 [Periplaneta americana]|uniref:DUF4817 domain-containing protein n=1 Tax=Periplaneta americana TaxID=6978 RepID=A0ABQ8SXH9_PERAM|nr:hypothetical protein ANN_14850 [Periplaneta americana]